MWFLGVGLEFRSAWKFWLFVFALWFVLARVVPGNQARPLFSLFSAVLAATFITILYAAFRAAFRPSRDLKTREVIRRDPIPWEFAGVMFLLGSAPVTLIGKAIMKRGGAPTQNEMDAEIIGLLAGGVVAVLATRARMAHKKKLAVPEQAKLPMSELERGGVLMVFLGTIMLALREFGGGIGFEIPDERKTWALVTPILLLVVGAALGGTGWVFRTNQERERAEELRGAEEKQRQASQQVEAKRVGKTQKKREKAAKESGFQPHKQEVLRILRWYDKERPKTEEDFEKHVRANQERYLRDAGSINSRYRESPFKERSFRDKVGEYAAGMWAHDFERAFSGVEVAAALTTWWKFEMECVDKAKRIAEDQKLGLDYPKVIEKSRLNLYLDAHHDKAAAIKEQRDIARAEADEMCARLRKGGTARGDAERLAAEHYETKMVPVRMAADESGLALPIDLDEPWSPQVRE